MSALADAPLVSHIARRDGVAHLAAARHIMRVRRRAVPRELEGRFCACGDPADCSGYGMSSKKTRFYCAECFSRIKNGNKSK